LDLDKENDVVMEGQGENEELYPIAVLIDELKVGEASTLFLWKMLTLRICSMMMFFYALTQSTACRRSLLPSVQSVQEMN
jgi:hypothetical protein